MLYQSTRNNQLRVKPYEVILKGISNDGGLFVPSEMPHLLDLRELDGASYSSCAKKVLDLFFPEFSSEEIDTCIDGAYGNNKFESNEIAPLHNLDDKAHVLELWHGPTCAFKDMALQLLPRLMTCAMKKAVDETTAEAKADKILILVATSGDTGKAALEGFKDVKNTKVVVFFPSDGVSNMQKLQMMTQEGNNVRVCGIRGNFDDAQTGVKQIFADEYLENIISQKGYTFSSANSINWGRLVPQIIYYVYSYITLLSQGRDEVQDGFNVCVPTGNFGNILAAYYAKQMGIPIRQLICASNSNDVLTEFLQNGVYDRNRPFYTTISPSMDILISSNLERLIFSACEYDSEYVKFLYKNLAINGRFEIEGKVLECIREHFSCGSCNEDMTYATIRNVYEEHKYVIDPHTAVAMNVYERYKQMTNDSRLTVIASTASPYKFPEAVLKSLDRFEDGLDDFTMLKRLSDISGTEIPQNLVRLKNKPIRFKDVIDPSEMSNIVISDII